MNGPFEVELKVHVSIDEDVSGVVTYSMPAGVYPSKESIDAGLAKVLEATRVMGEDARLASRFEFENAVIAARTGVDMKFATKEEWDAA